MQNHSTQYLIPFIVAEIMVIGCIASPLWLTQIILVILVGMLLQDQNGQFTFNKIKLSNLLEFTRKKNQWDTVFD